MDEPRKARLFLVFRFVTRHEMIVSAARASYASPSQHTRATTTHRRVGQHTVTRGRSVLTLYSMPPSQGVTWLPGMHMHLFAFVIITHRALFLSLRRGCHLSQPCVRIIYLCVAHRRPFLLLVV